MTTTMEIEVERNRRAEVRRMKGASLLLVFPQAGLEVDRPGTNREK